MKKILKPSGSILAIVCLILIQDCRLIDDDSMNEPCSSECTVIQGRFTTEDNKPVSNIPLELDWRVGPSIGIGLGGKIRKIARGKTDENGRYKFEFHANDEELTGGRYVVNFKLEEEGQFFLHEQQDDFEFYEITKRDTIINGDYHIAKRGAVLSLKIRNPEAIEEGEQLAVNVSFKAGLNPTGFYGIGTLNSSESNQLTIETAANQFAYLRTFKKTTNGYTSRLDSVFVQSDERKVLEIEF